jgi:hypothetical protein
MRSRPNRAPRQKRPCAKTHLRRFASPQSLRRLRGGTFLETPQNVSVFRGNGKTFREAKHMWALCQPRRLHIPTIWLLFAPLQESGEACSCPFHEFGLLINARLAHLSNRHSICWEFLQVVQIRHSCFPELYFHKLHASLDFSQEANKD